MLPSASPSLQLGTVLSGSLASTFPLSLSLSLSSSTRCFLPLSGTASSVLDLPSLHDHRPPPSTTTSSPTIQGACLPPFPPFPFLLIPSPIASPDENPAALVHVYRPYREPLTSPPRLLLRRRCPAFPPSTQEDPRCRCRDHVAVHFPPSSQPTNLLDLLLLTGFLFVRYLFPPPPESLRSPLPVFSFSFVAATTLPWTSSLLVFSHSDYIDPFHSHGYFLSAFPSPEMGNHHPSPCFFFLSATSFSLCFFSDEVRRRFDLRPPPLFLHRRPKRVFVPGVDLPPSLPPSSLFLPPSPSPSCPPCRPPPFSPTPASSLRLRPPPSPSSTAAVVMGCGHGGHGLG